SIDFVTDQIRVDHLGTEVGENLRNRRLAAADPASEADGSHWGLGAGEKIVHRVVPQRAIAVSLASPQPLAPSPRSQFLVPGSSMPACCKRWKNVINAGGSAVSSSSVESGSDSNSRILSSANFCRTLGVSKPRRRRLGTILENRIWRKPTMKGVLS